MMEWRFNRITFDLMLYGDDGEVLRVSTLEVGADKRTGNHHLLTVRTPDRSTDIEVCISPKGRNIRTHVRGREVHW